MILNRSQLFVAVTLALAVTSITNAQFKDGPFKDAPSKGGASKDGPSALEPGVKRALPGEGEYDPATMTRAKIEVAIAKFQKEALTETMELAFGHPSSRSELKKFDVTIRVPKHVKSVLEGGGFTVTQGFQSGFQLGLFISHLSDRKQTHHEWMLAEEPTLAAQGKDYKIYATQERVFRGNPNEEPKKETVYRFEVTVPLGLMDCWATSSRGGMSFDECLLMMASARTMKLKAKPPTDPVEALKFYHWQVPRDEETITWVRDSDYTTDRMLALLPRAKAFHSAEQLDLHNENITDDALKYLGAFKNLKTLDIRSDGINGSGCRHLIRLTKLTKLRLYGAVTDEGLKRVGLLRNVEELSLSAQYITDEGLQHLARMRSLKTLRIFNTFRWPIRGHGLKHLSNLPKLEKLDLSNMPITDEGLREFKRSLALQELDLGDTKVFGRGLDFSKFPKLRVINLRDTKVLDLTGVAKAPNLEEVTLYDTTVDDDEVLKLVQCKKLKSISLRDTNVTDTSVVALAKLPLLESISLGNTVITDAAVEALAKAPNLKHLDLARTPVTDRSVELIKAMKNLKSVELRRSRATEAAINALREARPKLSVY